MRYGLQVSSPLERRQRRSSAYDGPLFDEIDRKILVELQDDVVKIGTPNQFVKKWIEESDLIHTLAESLEIAYGRKVTPELVIVHRDDETSSAEAPSVPTAPAAAPEAVSAEAAQPITSFLEKDSSIQLKDDYKFESFIVGPNNRLAHAASLAVAESPGQTYNPLFIHGGVGLGKTHLLQAVSQKVLERQPDARILYLSCDSFVNQFINSVETGEMNQFRHRYRTLCWHLSCYLSRLRSLERCQWRPHIGPNFQR